MKAPDKIYMPNELLSEEWQQHIEGEDTAYIRKDALLEWLNRMLELSALAFEYQRNFTYGKVIEKINSM